MAVRPCAQMRAIKRQNNSETIIASECDDRHGWILQYLRSGENGWWIGRRGDGRADVRPFRYAILLCNSAVRASPRLAILDAPVNVRGREVHALRLVRNRTARRFCISKELLFWAEIQSFWGKTG